MQTTDVSLLEQIAIEFNSGERARNPHELLGLMNQYYNNMGKSPLAHLDDINSGHATQGLGGILGFKPNNPRQMGQRLVEFGIFSQRLSDYSPELLEKIIGNVSKPRFSSFYLAEDNEYAKENREVIAASLQMKDYLASKGIAHLDDINKGHATRGLGGMLGFKQGNPRQMGQRLVELGIFSRDLSDSSYNDVRERICENLVNKIGSHGNALSSFYTSADMDSTILESNQRLLLPQKQSKISLVSKDIT